MTVVLDTLGAQQGVQTDGLADIMKRMTNAATPNYNAIYKKIEKWELVDQLQVDSFNTKRELCKTKLEEALAAFTDMVEFMKTYKADHPKEKDIPSISL